MWQTPAEWLTAQDIQAHRGTGLGADAKVSWLSGPTPSTEKAALTSRVAELGPTRAHCRESWPTHRPSVQKTNPSLFLAVTTV